MRFVIFILFTLFIFSRCAKRNNPISWNSNLSIPISKDSLFLKDFLNMDKLYFNPNENYYSYIDTFSLFELNQEDFLPTLDFSFSEALNFPLPFAIPPNQTSPITLSSNHNFNFQDLQLREVSFNSLKFTYSISSNIDGDFYLIMHLPYAYDANGNQFYDTIEILNSSNLNNVIQDELIIENHVFDLSKNGTTFNSITTSFQVKSGDDTIPGNISSNINMDMELSEMNINYMKGYFGNMEIEDQITTSIPIMEKLDANKVTLLDPELNLIIKNGIGMDAQFYLNEMELNKANNTSYLTHNIINQPININRAEDLGWDFNYSISNILINQQNSNLSELLTILPNEINTSYSIITNPMGNHTGFNDFYFSNRPLSLDLSISTPLVFNFNSLTYIDTILVELSDVVKINEATIDLEIENTLPKSICFDLHVLNGNQITLSQNCIEHGVLDANNNVVSPSMNVISAQLDSINSSILLNEQKIIMNVSVNSPDTLSSFPIMIDQYINYKMGMMLNANFSVE